MNLIIEKPVPNSPDISVVIPIYNAQKYLNSCINSVIKQTLENIEVICVDDCSSDSSLKIVKKYVGTDKRIRLLRHSINMGEGSARNTGLNKARGEYVFHLDADDTIPLDALKLLYSHATKHSSDIVKGTFVLKFNDGSLSLPVNPTPKVENTNIYNSDFLQQIPSSHCSYLYRRSLLEKNSIRYPTELTIGLDLITLTKSLLYAKKVTLIPNVVYHYRQTQNSATRGVLAEETILEGIKTKEIICELLENVHLVKASQGYKQRWEEQIHLFWINMSYNHPPEVCFRVFSSFRKMVSRQVVPWEDNVPHQIRYVLALLLAEKDQDAIDFLCSEEISSGFSNSKKLLDAMEFVLTQVPSDKYAINVLGKTVR